MGVQRSLKSQTGQLLRRVIRQQSEFALDASSKHQRSVRTHSGGRPCLSLSSQIDR